MSWQTIRPTGRYAAIALVAGVGLLAASWAERLEGLRIGAAALLVAAAICAGVAAGFSADSVAWLKRLPSLLSRSATWIAIAVLAAPTLIGLIFALTHAVRAASEHALAQTAIVIAVGASMLLVMVGAVAAAVAAVRGSKPAAPADTR